MTASKIKEYRILAEKHRNGHRSAQIILELLNELELTRNAYCVALDVAYTRGKIGAIALKKLKASVGN